MRGRIAVAAGLAIVASLLGPVSVSNAALVTKTFTVTKGDGTAYANVHVGLFGWDNDSGRPISSSIVQTNASGVASIQVDEQAQFWQWAVQPPSNDFSHAPAAGELVLAATESISVQLKSANTKVLVQASDGSSVPIGADLYYPATGQPGGSNTWIKMIRPGGFGLDLSTNISTTGKFELGIAVDYSPGNYYRSFGLTRTQSNGQSTFNLFSDLTYQQSSLMSTTSIDGHDVYLLRFNPANLSGSLLGENGASISFGPPISGEVVIQKSSIDGYVDPDWGGSWSSVESDGSFKARLENPVAGRYVATFRIAGSHSLPSFVGPEFFVDSFGNYSMSQSGPFVSPSLFRYSVNAPSSTNTLKIRAVDPVTRASVDSYISLEEQSNFGWNWYGPGRATNGLASYSLRDGSYILRVNPVNAALVEQQFTVLIDQGQYILKTKSGETLSPNGQGVYETAFISPNLMLKIVNPDDPSTTLNYYGVEVRNANADEYDDPVAYGNPVNGQIPLFLPNGQYKILVQVNQNRWTPREYNLTISNGAITLVDSITNTTINPTNGVYSVIPAPANVIGKIVGPDSQSLDGTWNGSSGRVERKVGNSWRYLTWTNINRDGTFAFRANTSGDYRLVVMANQSPLYARSSYEFSVVNPSQLLDLGNKAIRATNFRFAVVAAGTNDPIPYANISINPITANVSTQDFESWASTNREGLAGTELLATGTYKVLAQRPYDFPSNTFADKEYTLTVSGTPGNLTFSIPGITPTNGVFTLALGTPNVTGVVVSPSGQPMVIAGERWVDAIVKKQDGSEWEWTSYGSNVSRAGEFGFNIQETGTFRIEVRPYGFADAGKVYSETFEITNLNMGSLVRNFPALALRTPTAKLGVVLPGESTPIQSYIDIRKVDQFGETLGFDSLYSGSNPVMNYSADSTGTFDFTVNPNWNNRMDAISKTYRGTVTGTGPNDFSLSIPGASVVNGVTLLPLGAPNIRGRVVASNGELVNLNNAYLNIQVERFDEIDQQWLWSEGDINVGRDGRFIGAVREAGKYRLRIYPYGLTNQTMVFSDSFTVTQQGLANLNQNFGDIRLGAPNLTGEVLAPTGSTKVSNAQVTAVDLSTGREVWESSSQTDAEGKWFMNLPAGRYSLVAKAPWGTVSYGDSEPIANVVIASNGSATINGSASSNIQIRLSTPTWSGTLVDPVSNNPIPQAAICVWHDESDNFSSRCSYTNNQGQWALSKPTVFTGFNSSTTLSIQPRIAGDLVERRLQGSLAVSQALGSYTPGNTYQNIVLTPAQPNVSITVKAGLNNATNVWVNVSKPGVGWLASGTTNNSGVAKLYIPNVSGPLDIDVYTNGNSAMRENFANTRKSMTVAEVSAGISGSNFATTVNLAIPNLRAIVYKPGSTPSTPGEPMGGAYISVFNETLNEWLDSYSANAAGEVPASLPVPANGSYRYKLRVEPAFNNPELLMPTEYFATVQANGNLTLTTSSNSPVTALGGKFPVVLTAPTITGTVTSADGSLRIRDSRILPMDISSRFDLWEYGTYSNRLGEFGLVLPNGSYLLVAHPSWGRQSEARSARCQVDIFNGALVSPASDCIRNGKVNLKLREPNLKFRLVHNGQPVKWANVHLSVGNWYTNAASNSDGTVALFIDSDEITAKNPGMTGTQDIHVQVEPNYETTGIVRWTCNSGDTAMPLCSQLTDFVSGQDYALPNNGDLGNITFMQPNTKLTVRAPGAGAVKPGSWVTLFKQEQGWMRWISSDNTDANGIAEFNLDSSMISDAAALYTLEIQPPWNERSTFARTQYKDLTYAQLNNAIFELRSPNLKIQVLQAFNGAASKWSHVEIFKKVSNNWQWHDWASSDQAGIAAILLESAGDYQVKVYPGSGARGTTVTCDLLATSNANTIAIEKVAGACDAGGNLVDSLIPITLSPGNLRGTITADGAGIAGAIVFAEAISDDGTQVIAGKTAEAVTNSDGSYGLQLSDQYRWRVKVFYVNPGGASIRYGSILTPLLVEKAELTANKTLNASLPRQ